MGSLFKKSKSATTSGKSATPGEAGVAHFLDAVKKVPTRADNAARGRLIFALDATASRQATWDRAMRLQGDMFVKTRGMGNLDVQLVFYRGYRECRSSPWLKDSETLLGMMKKVTCEAGGTQILRILDHSLAETRLESVQALVFVGDCVEESLDELARRAGELKLLGLPLFIFQEGSNTQAGEAFATLARLSGGAHCQFDERSADQLGQLLNAVAAYATGGRQALKQLQREGSGSASLLLEQLD